MHILRTVLDYLFQAKQEDYEHYVDIFSYSALGTYQFSQDMFIFTHCPLIRMNFVFIPCNIHVQIMRREKKTERKNNLPPWGHTHTPSCKQTISFEVSDPFMIAFYGASITFNPFNSGMDAHNRIVWV